MGFHVKTLQTTKKKSIWLLLLVCVLFLNGCSLTHHYVVKRPLPKLPGVKKHALKPLHKKWKQQLKKGTKVVFVPPARCRGALTQTDEDPKSIAFKNKRLRLDCGGIMERFRMLAERMGLKVVSWGELQGSKPPSHYAKQLGVSFFIEIKAFGLAPLKMPTTSEQTITFFTMDRSFVRTPLKVGSYTRTRCSDTFQNIDKSTRLILSIELKPASRKTVLWHYRSDSSHSQLQSELFYPYKKPVKAGYMALLIGGSVLFLYGTFNTASMLAGSKYILPQFMPFYPNLSFWSASYITLGLIVGTTGAYFAMMQKITPHHDDSVCSNTGTANPKTKAAVRSTPNLAKHLMMDFFTKLKK